MQDGGACQLPSQRNTPSQCAVSDTCRPPGQGVCLCHTHRAPPPPDPVKGEPSSRPHTQSAALPRPCDCAQQLTRALRSWSTPSRERVAPRLGLEVQGSAVATTQLVACEMKRSAPLQNQQQQGQPYLSLLGPLPHESYSCPEPQENRGCMGACGPYSECSQIATSKEGTHV